MIWKNLKAGLCPKCSNKLITVGLLMPDYGCTSQSCDFKMGEEAYKRIIENMQRLQTDLDDKKSREYNGD